MGVILANHLALSTAHLWPGEFRPQMVTDQIHLQGHDFPVHETTLLRTPFFALLHFVHPLLGTIPRVLVVAPLSGVRPQLLYDMLTGLLPACDLHLLVWTNPIEIPVEEGPFGLDDDIGAVIESLRALGAGVHLVGLCQSALPVLAASSILSASAEQARPASLVLIGGKLDTRINATRLDRIARSHSPNGMRKMSSGQWRRTVPAAGDVSIP